MFVLHMTLTRQNILFLNKQQIVCYFRLIVFSQESVPLFGPPLPSPPEFYDPESFRDFLLVKRKLPRVVNILFIKKRFTCKYTTWVISCNLIKKIYVYLPRRFFSKIISHSEVAQNAYVFP